MNNENNNGDYQIWKGYLLHSKSILKINRKMSFLIKSFCLELMPDDLLSRVKKSDLMKELEVERKFLKLSQNSKLKEIITYEEFSSILEKLFKAAFAEEKSNKATFSTAAIFRLVADLCGVFVIWERIENEDEIKKISKIIKFTFY